MRGRPRRIKGERTDVRVVTRVAQSEREALDRAAEKEGRDVSAIMRDALAEYLEASGFLLSGAR
jgi:uncharacterized protein (DUF1778 family)